MKKLILLPLLLSFVFCNSQKYQIQTQGNCHVLSQLIFEKSDIVPPKNCNGHIIIYPNNIVEMSIDFGDNVREDEKFELTEMVVKKSYYSTWKGKKIIGEKYWNDVLVRVDHTGDSYITFYICFIKTSSTGTYYNCKME